MKTDQLAFDRIFHMGFWEYLVSNSEAGETFDQQSSSIMRLGLDGETGESR